MSLVGMLQRILHHNSSFFAWFSNWNYPMKHTKNFRWFFKHSCFIELHFESVYWSLQIAHVLIKFANNELQSFTFQTRKCRIFEPNRERKPWWLNLLSSKPSGFKKAFNLSNLNTDLVFLHCSNIKFISS